MEATIEVRGLRKSFGSTLALDGMTFTVAPGQVTGFIGPNGAGKTTTMRVILGLDAPDEGTALVGGRRYAALRRPMTHLGSLLDAAALQPSRSGRNHLLWLAHSQGLDARRADAALGQAGLAKAARRRAGLVSSHLMSELEGTADHLVIVGRGKVIADTSTRDLLAAVSGDRVTLRTTAPDRAAAALGRAGATAATTDGGTVTVTGLAAEKVVLVLNENGVPFSEVSAHRATLEEAYLELTRDAVEYRAQGAVTAGGSGGSPPRADTEAAR